jgi:hypothetical protein
MDNFPEFLRLVDSCKKLSEEKLTEIMDELVELSEATLQEASIRFVKFTPTSPEIRLILLCR